MVSLPGSRLPSLAQTLMFLADPMESQIRARERYGDIYHMRNFAFGDEVVVSDPELIREIFGAPSDHLAAGEANAPLGGFVGDHSVLLLDGREHVRHRRIMLPSFHGARIRRYATIMRDVTDAELDSWRSGEVRPLLPAMQRITLEVILRTVFGLDASERCAPLRMALHDVIQIFSSPLTFLLMRPSLQRDLLGISPWAEIRRRLARVDELIYREIVARRLEQSAANAPARDDVLSILLEARDERGDGLSDVELRDELITLLAAGHETTATALSWAFERLLAHPIILARVRRELAEVLGEEPLGEEHPAQLSYLDATITEVLRVRPPVPFVGRYLKAPYRLGGYSLPAGWLVVPSVFGVHFRADLYPEPRRFDPERFVGQRPDLYRWIPFGGGTRRCLGMAFALFEMKAVLAVTLPRVQLALTRPAPLRVVPRNFVMAPQGGTEVIVRAVAARARATRTTDGAPAALPRAVGH